MTRPTASAAILVVALALARGASAQNTGTQDTKPAKWIEAGGGFGLGLGYVPQLYPSLVARVNVAPRTAVEAGTDFFLPGRTRAGLEGSYRLQVQQSLGSLTRQTVPFVTGGIVGDFRYRSYPEYRSPLPTGDTLVIPAQKEGRIRPPQFFAAGGGVRRRLGNHMFFETGAQLWMGRDGVEFAANAGVTIPIGPRR